ncbi:hypothetical protein HORIV_29790 [Vreelandella olivaria]|uniref:Uncharacterized protein n=1 Tax=Vreelandella olivaria TaxID=390919 RepID=A0ABM7GIV8_9GAMM|nr:hypothetical protein HORIV_29790 [Halomonas olivaria]
MQTAHDISQNRAAAAAGLKAAVRILDKWRASGEQGKRFYVFRIVLTRVPGVGILTRSNWIAIS